MTVPFKVKAVYEYRSGVPDDLNFDNGQIITVIEEDDADWYTGEFTNAAGQQVEGIFPRNFVEKYEPAIPSRPARTQRKIPLPDPPAAEPQAPTVSRSNAAPSEATSIPHLPAAEPPQAHDVSREAEIEPPKEFSEPPSIARPEPQSASAPAPAPVGATATTAAENKPPIAKKPPPVVEKPSSSSFRDRIAAFNKPAAAPVAPFKPGGSGTGTGFVKKPFVAPPPSRNAYVPPPKDPPSAKVYRREEELEAEAEGPEQDVDSRLPVTSERTAPQDEEDQPKPTSLKDRIALLQQQQLEQAQRQAESSKKKEKPKRPSKPRTESSEVPTETQAVERDSQLERVSVEQPARHTELVEDEPPIRKSLDDIGVASTPPLPLRELVSDTNDADDSGAADTEDAHDVSTEEERPRPRSMKSPPIAAAKTEPPVEVDNEEDAEEEDEEEEDPEMRRKRELRERMAKMSGGMGMMGMFGAGAPAPSARKQRPVREDRQQEPYEEEEAQRAPPVPVMALPGISNIKQASKLMPVPTPDSDDEYENDNENSQPTPVATRNTEPLDDDYISQRPSRRSTERSQPLSPQDRAPPPPLPAGRPEPPQSPGARPVPPPPPPTRHAGELPLARGLDESDDDSDVPNTFVPRPPPISTTSIPSRAVPPPLPTQPRSADTDAVSRAVPPVPMSPTSPQIRPPPPPPPGQAPSRRSTTESSLQPPIRDDSEDEVTEYDGDYDTDIASGDKHKAALKSRNRDSSIEEGALSDDAADQISAPPPRAVPPPVPSTALRDLPPPPPPQAAPRPRESVDSPRAAPPPVPFAQASSRPRESVDFPRTAPPPVPPSKSPIGEEEYDPYRYSAPPSGLPGMIASLRQPTEEFDDDYNEQSQQIYQPPDRAAPPPPPVERAAPPPLPASQAPVYHEPDHMAMSGALEAPQRSVELGRSNTTSRRSADVSRPTHDQSFIASDVDLAQQSMWWTQENNPPPSLQNRYDVLWETESSSTPKRGGRTSVSRDVYVLYQDYSQTTVNATYDASEPSHVSFEQNHERPPSAPRKDQLENASGTFGSQIAKNAEKAVGNTIGEGTAQEFVLSLIRPLTTALLPIGTKSYGALVYANLANASTQQFDEIRPGDIVTFRNAKFAGHKGGLHQKYSTEVGKPEHVAVVIDWDGTKKKIRAWEQGNQEKGKKTKVREESYRVSDLKSGEVRVWRVMPRSYVNWGTA